MLAMKWAFLVFMLAISCEVCFSNRIDIVKNNKLVKKTSDEAEAEGLNIHGGFEGSWTLPWGSNGDFGIGFGQDHDDNFDNRDCRNPPPSFTMPNPYKQGLQCTPIGCPAYAKCDTVRLYFDHNYMHLDSKNIAYGAQVNKKSHGDNGHDEMSPAMAPESA